MDDSTCEQSKCRLRYYRDPTDRTRTDLQWHHCSHRRYRDDAHDGGGDDGLHVIMICL